MEEGEEFQLSTSGKITYATNLKFGRQIFARKDKKPDFSLTVCIVALKNASGYVVLIFWMFW